MRNEHAGAGWEGFCAGRRRSPWRIVLSALSVCVAIESADGTLHATDCAASPGMVTPSTPHGSVPDIRDRLVNFKIRDVYIPDPREILVELYANDILQGKVLDLTDTGSAKQAFVVVEVEGVGRHVIVPIERILSVL
jgi:hypothetical protein